MNPIQEARRGHHRTSLFVLASMTAPGVSGPVKIRNLSLCGALIEGGAMPGMGQPVTLWRGERSVSGRIVWRYDDKAGVRFDDQVEVAHWLPTAVSDRRRVDRTIKKLETTLPTADYNALSVADALDSLDSDLFEDEAVAMAFASKLQTLETASQLLRKLAAGCSTEPQKGSRMTSGDCDRGRAETNNAKSGSVTP